MLVFVVNQGGLTSDNNVGVVCEVRLIKTFSWLCWLLIISVNFTLPHIEMTVNLHNGFGS